MRLIRKISTLRGQIILTLISVTVLIVLLVGLLLPGLVERYLAAQLHRRLTVEAQIIAEYSGQQFDRGERSDIDIFAKRLGQKIGTRVTIVAIDGTVVGESDAERAFLTNHGDRPEIVAALKEGTGQSTRYSVTVQDELLYGAVPIQTGGTVWGTVRVALPYAEVRRLTAELVQVILLVAGIAGILVILIGIRISRAIARPLEQAGGMAKALADGRFDQMIRPAGPAEVVQLGEALNQTAQALRHSFEALSTERERLSNVLAYLVVGVVLCEDNGRVILANPAAVRLLRVPVAAVIGHPVDQVVRDPQLLEFLQECRTDECRNCSLTLEYAHPPRFVRALASRLGVDEHEHLLIVLEDLTDLKRLEAVRRNFFVNISHELRTPLAAISAAIDALQEGAIKEPEVAADFVQRLRQETDNLVKMVEELLMLARIDAGRAPLDMQVVEANELLEDSVQRLRPLAERAGLELVLAPGPEVIKVFADREHLRRVLTNLLHNAVKFTPASGRIVVRLQRVERCAQFSVADNGLGLTDEEKERIFERFYKADRSRASSGSGLGLAIAKHIVQAHQGRIWADSPGPGQGATFFFTIPLA